MPDTPTANYGWVVPLVGSDTDTWGTELKTDLNAIDAQVFTVSNVANAASTAAAAAQSTANAAIPKAGGTATGVITFNAGVARVTAGGFRNLASTLTTSGGSTVTYTADALVMEDGSGNTIRSSGLNVTLNLTINGAGGLDTGAVASNAWYFIFGIYNASGSLLSAVASLSSTSPSMPSGYTFLALIGVVRTDGTGHIVPFYQRGRSWHYFNAGSGLPQIASGSTSNLWVAISVAAFAPTIASRIRGSLITPQSGSSAVAPNGNYSTTINSTSNPPPVGMVTGSAAGSQNTPFDFMLESSNIYYLSGSAAPAAAYCLGFEMNLY